MEVPSNINEVEPFDCPAVLENPGPEANDDSQKKDRPTVSSQSL